MRLFAALPLPDVAVERFLSLRLRLSAPKDGLRWSEPGQWHITLQFFGDMEPAQAACLQASLEELASPAPEVALTGLGLFAAKGILFATVEPSTELIALHANILARMKRCNISPEDRPFHPHITLARSKGKTGYGTLRQMSTPVLPSFGAEVRWTAHECLLLQSTLHPEGAIYTVHDRIRLGHLVERLAV